MMKLNQGLLEAILTAFKTSFNNGYIRAYGGASMPDEPCDTETGTMLWESTTFTFGSITWDDTNKKAVLAITAAETANASASGTVEYLRVYDSTKTTDASTSAVRFDVSVSQSGNVTISSSDAVAGKPLTVDQLNIELPSYRR